jgi:outer membrane protein
MHHTHRLLVLAALLACGAAQAQSHTLKFGAVRYDTNAKTNGVTGIGIPPGADATIGDATTVVMTYEYALSPHVGVELVLGVPPKIKATAAGSVAFLGEVLTARNVAPTLFFTYHFGAPSNALRPYAGIGVNYTKFTNVTTPYGWDVSLSDSTGLAAHVGVDWALNKQWGLWASLGAVEVRSKLVATGATVLQSTIDFRPLTYSVGASFKF